MIYEPDNQRTDSFIDRAKLRGVTAYSRWLASHGGDSQQIRYLDGFDWRMEHLPPSIIPFLHAEQMTPDEADEFFAQFNSENREALATLEAPALLAEYMAQQARS